jgi:hypothetical protein
MLPAYFLQSMFADPHASGGVIPSLLLPLVTITVPFAEARYSSLLLIYSLTYEPLVIGTFNKLSHH